MSTAPGDLRDLRAYIAAKTGLSLIKLGIVGDRRHLSGYHLGKDRIYDGTGPGRGDQDYSVRTARDKAGLTNDASALDIGLYGGLRELSGWLVRQARAERPGTRDLREVIYTLDGRTVLRWDRERGADSTPRPGEADDSHLTHTHISYYRDSRGRDKRPLFARYFDAEDDSMGPIYNAGGRTVTLPVGEPLYDEPDGPQAGAIGDGPGEGAGATVYRVIAFDQSTAPRFALIDGGGEGKRCKWIKWP
jgi:hypothetical protein